MLNRATFNGRLTKDVELRYTETNKTPVARFTIAVDRTFKAEGQPEADYIPVVVWGKSAENCSKFIGKGRLVAVDGKIQTRKYEKDNVTHYVFELVAAEVHFLDRASKDGSPDKVKGDEPEEELPM